MFYFFVIQNSYSQCGAIKFLLPRFRMEYRWRKMIRGEEKILKIRKNNSKTGLAVKFLIVRVEHKFRNVVHF